MDTKNSYKNAEPYLAYCRGTNEKHKLHDYISSAFDKEPVNILDLGCGNGVNTSFIADRFQNASVDAIERSGSQIQEAISRNSRSNINYVHTPFEQFETYKRYDFILASHVLQYIDSDLESFVKTATSMLEKDGEIWFVQQTKEGMAQIISHQRPYLTNERFQDWKTFEDYQDTIEKLVGKDYQISVDSIDSSFAQIDFANPSEEEKLRLEFIFCLDSSYDGQSQDFKDHLSRLKLGNGERISHPNGILKIRRVK
jgi:cyclopropane fatty-acyl-phospholipid synthase-like methyltransferase